MTTPSLGSENRVWLNSDDIIEISVVGKQSAETVHAMGEQILALALQQKEQGRPVLVLDDLSRMSLKQPTEVPRTVAAEAKRVPFKRLAMRGPKNRLLRYTANFIIRGVKMERKIKYFIDRDEAIRWLQH